MWNWSNQLVLASSEVPCSAVNLLPLADQVAGEGPLADRPGPTPTRSETPRGTRKLRLDGTPGCQRATRYGVYTSENFVKTYGLS